MNNGLLPRAVRSSDIGVQFPISRYLTAQPTWRVAQCGRIYLEKVLKQVVLLPRSSRFHLHCLIIDYTVDQAFQLDIDTDLIMPLAEESCLARISQWVKSSYRKIPIPKGSSTFHQEPTIFGLEFRGCHPICQLVPMPAYLGKKPGATVFVVMLSGPNLMARFRARCCIWFC